MGRQPWLTTARAPTAPASPPSTTPTAAPGRARRRRRRGGWRPARPRPRPGRRPAGTRARRCCRARGTRRWGTCRGRRAWPRPGRRTPAAGSPPMCRLSPTRVTSSRYGVIRAPGSTAAQAATAGPCSRPVAVADHARWRWRRSPRGRRRALMAAPPGRGRPARGRGPRRGRRRRTGGPGARRRAGARACPTRDLRRALQVRPAAIPSPNRPSVRHGSPASQGRAGDRRRTAADLRAAHARTPPHRRRACAARGIADAGAGTATPSAGCAVRSGRGRAGFARQQQVHARRRSSAPGRRRARRAAAVAGEHPAVGGRHAQADVADGLGRGAAVGPGDPGDPDARRRRRTRPAPRPRAPAPPPATPRRASRSCPRARRAGRLGLVGVRHDPARTYALRPRPVDQPRRRAGPPVHDSPVATVSPGPAAPGRASSSVRRAVRADQVFRVPRRRARASSYCRGVLGAGLRPDVDLQLGAAQARRHLDPGEVASCSRSRSVAAISDSGRP